jgi:hypothetical protein
MIRKRGTPFSEKIVLKQMRVYVKVRTKFPVPTQPTRRRGRRLKFAAHEMK